MICPTGVQLKSFYSGELSDEQSGELESHIRDCEKCRTDLDSVAHCEDSLVARLKQTDDQAKFDAEPECQVSILRALETLAADRDERLWPNIPSEIGEYELVKSIGSGGMSKIYLARHTKLGRQVALKVLADHRASQAGSNQRFESEIRAIGQLSHPNIVSAYDAREIDGTKFLVTEFIDGLDIGKIVQNIGPLPIADACQIGRQVALALEYTSSAGFVHRDVKPSNVMLSRGGEVKLLDLGLARLQSANQDASEVTGTGQILGTADYMAPEQVSDSRGVDVRADIYSLGCMLFKMLAGRAPFADEDHATAYAKMNAHTSSVPPTLCELRRDMPIELSRFVDKMLDKKPANRPARPLLVVRQLEKFSSGANLAHLLQRAERDSSNQTRTTEAVPSNSQARRVTFFKRQVSMSTAIGAVVAALIFGICLGILIKIKYPDGSTALVKLPSGSQVSIESIDDKEADKQSSVDNNQARVEIKSAPVEAVNSSPISMVVLISKAENEQAITQAVEKLRSSTGLTPVVTDAGTWYPLANGVKAKFIAQIKRDDKTAWGLTWALAANRPDYIVTGDELVGQLGMQQDSRGRTLLFGPKLLEKLRLLSSENIQQNFGLVFNGQVVFAPVIQREFTRSMDITEARLTTDDMRQLQRWLNGDPFVAPQSQAKPDTKGDNAPESPHSDNTPNAKGQTETGNKLLQIAQAFHEFHEQNQSYPSSVNYRNMRTGVDSAAVPHPFSWRVAILPFIGHAQLMQEYDFNQAWDSSHNLLLLDKMPEIFRSPNAPVSQTRGHANFLGFSGPFSALGTRVAKEIENAKAIMGRGDSHQQRGEYVSKFDIEDGTNNTLLVMESQQSIPWTKPEDPQFAKPSDLRQAMFFENHPITFVMVSGRVVTLDPSDPTALSVLAKCITRAGEGGDEAGQ